jgi:hypothetical protein
MNNLPLRIGVWFQENHAPFGGPFAVLVGTLLGFIQQAEEKGESVIILLNERGDVNWSLARTRYPESDAFKMPSLWCGPLAFSHADAECTEYTSHPTWQTVHNALFPSEWFRSWVCSGLPYLEAEKAEGRQTAIWAAGVDTDFFSPASPVKKTQDYFIYYKSQNAEHLNILLKYLFEHWFGLRGTVVPYYNYDREMLRAAARASKFCILLDNTETQGLATLEILATGCPIFVCDVGAYVGKTKVCHGATSVPYWNGSCGTRSSLAKIAEDFPVFIQNLSTYDPRGFATALFSYKASAEILLNLLSREHHQPKDHKEEKDRLDK